MIGGGANTPKRNVGGTGGAPPTTFGGAEFMQGMFTAMKQVVRNTVQAMQVPIRAADTRATTAMKAFLQLRPSTFQSESGPLVAEDWLEQVTRVLRHNSSDGGRLASVICTYQLQGVALQ